MRHFLKSGVLLLTLISSVGAMACDCGTQLPQISKEETERYGLIFVGRIDSLREGEKIGTAWFKGLELYKGLGTPEVEIRYDAYTSCRMPFAPGQTWIIYASKNPQNGRWHVEHCSRSRKLPEDGETDEYTIYSNITYEEERKFLASNYSLKDFIKEETVAEIEKGNKKVIDSNREIIYANYTQKILLVLGSIVGMGLIYLLVKKVWK